MGMGQNLWSSHVTGGWTCWYIYQGTMVLTHEWNQSRIPGKEGTVELEVFMSVPVECLIGGYFDI